jgi:hypothetical protein
MIVINFVSPYEKLCESLPLNKVAAARGDKMKKPCCSCEYRGDLFKLGDSGIPHCHCHHPSVPEKDFGWGSLREGFWTCDKFKRRLKAVENRQAIAQQAQAKTG